MYLLPELEIIVQRILVMYITKTFLKWFRPETWPFLLFGVENMKVWCMIWTIYTGSLRKYINKLYVEMNLVVMF